MKENLLPCPFCGSPAELHERGEYWVSCSYKGVCPCSLYEPRIHGCAYLKDAVRIWNQRTRPARSIDLAGPRFVNPETVFTHGTDAEPPRMLLDNPAWKDAKR